MSNDFGMAESIVKGHDNINAFGMAQFLSKGHITVPILYCSAVAAGVHVSLFNDSR
jgi:hypothetical protein